MRAALTTLVFVALAYAANAQLSLTPKAGIESSNTSLNFNDLRCVSPLGAVISPQIGLRLDYKFKKNPWTISECGDHPLVGRYTI